MSTGTDDKTDKSTQEQWDDLKLKDQIGITAHIEREQENNPTMRRANRALNDIGDFVHEGVPSVRELDYLGSACVHIFMAPALNQLVFVTQTQPLRETPERVAGPAFTQLQKDMMTHFGRKTTKIRSGF